MVKNNEIHRNSKRSLRRGAGKCRKSQDLKKKFSQRRQGAEEAKSMCENYILIPTNFGTNKDYKGLRQRFRTKTLRSLRLCESFFFDYVVFLQIPAPPREIYC